MSAAVALLVAAAGTFALRYGSVRALAHRRIPAAVEDILRHAALAVIAALVVASLPASGGALPSAGAVVALVSAAVVARRTRDITAAIAVALVVSAAATALPV